MIGIGNGRAWAVVACLVGALGLASGCNSEKPEGNVPPADPLVGPSGAASPQEVLGKLPGGEEFAAGKKVYADNNCARCHKLGETGGGGGAMAGPPVPGGPGAPPPAPGAMPGGPSGPDLTKTGANADHTKQWLADHIRDAKKHKSSSRMPEFGPDRISDADLGKLAEYLASRK